MKQYKFSVSTSFYKRSDFVESLYQQLLEQTYTNWEWIVTDDFSPEKNAEEKLREIAANDPRVKYIDQEFKKQLFYNPQIGCSGEIIFQTDSDDIIAPKILEHYNYWFNKHPEVYGMSCSYATKENIEYPSLVGRWVTESNYDLTGFNTMDSMTMGRAWRNVIPHFESEGFQWYQNDTNIIRHIENVGKWMWIPRVLYWYNHTPDSFSKALYTEEQIADIERERQIIENRFPHIKEREECSFVTKYIPVWDKLAAFYESDECHFSKTKQTINYICPEIKTFEKELIREIYWDWDITFNDLTGVKTYDDILIYLTPENASQLGEIINTLKPLYPKQIVRIFFKSKDYDQDFFDKIFSFYIWSITENEGYVRIWL